MKQFSRRKIIAVIVAIMILILVLASLLTKGAPINQEKISLLKTGWTTEVTENPVSPYFPSKKKVYELVMSHPVDTALSGKTLSFRTNDSYVDAFLSDSPLVMEGEPVYHFGETLAFCDSPGTYTHFIDLPLSEGQYINIRIQTVYKNKFLTSYQVASGSRNSLIFDYLQKERSSIVQNIIMLIFGVLLLIIYFVEKHKQLRGFETLSLGVLSIAFSVYANCPLFFNQYLFQNGVTQYYMNYFALFLLPLLAMLYFEEIVPGLNLRPLFYGFIVLELLLSVLHFTTLASYTKTIKIFTASLGVFAVVSLIKIGKRYKTLERRNRFSLNLLLFFVLANVFFFIFVSTLGNQSFISRIGFLLYLVFAIYSGLTRIMNSIYKERETELLHEIAYTDNLTKLGNRYALERDATAHNVKDISIVSLDLNYLKRTNDSLGHAGGDVLLKCAAKCLASVYENVYRVGGDEFIALVYGATEDELKSREKQLTETVAKMNADRHDFGEYAGISQFSVSIASGFCQYYPGAENYEQIMSKADQVMYENKKKLHSL